MPSRRGARGKRSCVSLGSGERRPEPLNKRRKTERDEERARPGVGHQYWHLEVRDPVSISRPCGDLLEQPSPKAAPAICCVDVEVPDSGVALRQPVRLVFFDSAADETDHSVLDDRDEVRRFLAADPLAKAREEFLLRYRSRNDAPVGICVMEPQRLPG